MERDVQMCLVDSTGASGNNGRRLVFTVSSNDIFGPRIGGGALIGGIADWPVVPDGTALLLVASIPSAFIVQHSGLEMPEDLFISVFSYYSEQEYFLDQITYHGNRDELTCIQAGTTRVLLHQAGEEVFQTDTIPPYCIDLDSDLVVDNDCGSYIGGRPGFLQRERLDLPGLRFILQLRSSDFPGKYADIFGLADAVGYLYAGDGKGCQGMFFAQVT